jgi:predicted N-formylglutamate amidohydrolase
MPESFLLISCEHAANAIPDKYKKYFEGEQKLLDSHRGYDIGATQIYQAFVKQLKPDFNLAGEYSRLLIELNRSTHHPQLFSVISKSFSENEKEQILNTIYHPYRDKIENKIRQAIERQQKVLHLSVHTFTPELEGKKREAEIGLLYDPANELEKSFCKRWKQEIKLGEPALGVRFNYPYKGTADGFTTYLRKAFSENYAGIELEVRNDYVTDNKAGWARTLIATFAESLNLID